MPFFWITSWLNRLGYLSLFERPGIHVPRKVNAVRLALSVFIIARNEEVRLARCLQALASWVGEIVLVDSDSTDQTVEIARSYGARVLNREWTGYGPQKRFAEQQCRYDWVLNVDADEVVTPALRSEIESLFNEASPALAAYRVRILTVYPGQSKPRLWANDHNVVRLYHRSVGSYSDDAVYDRVDIGDRRALQLRAPIYHHTHISIVHSVQKALTFSEFRAGASNARSSWLLKARLLTEFPMVFFKTYIGRRHFTGGWQGYYFALVHAFMRTTRLALMFEASSANHAPSPTQLKSSADSGSNQTHRQSEAGNYDSVSSNR